MRLCILTFLLLLAHPALAAVSINEVAWMGSSASVDHEWIELYNSGPDAVIVDGWTLSDGARLTITLSGTIGGNGYAVLERASEDSSAAPAFLVYVNRALVNTGATLTLRDVQSVIIDQVAGGTDWKNIGGDNTTKETAQYQSSGWVTDVATPGRANGTGRVEATPPPPPPPPPQEDIVVTTPTTSGGTTNTVSGSRRSNKSSDSIRLRDPEIKLTVIPDVQAVAYTHQSIPFNVRTGGVDANLEKLVRYEWNFGDSFTGTGKNPKHAYAYPGTYVVTVRAEYKKNVQVARHELTILPVNFSLTKNSDGAVQVHNDAPYDVDVSGYTLRGTKEVTFPPRTIMAARGTITVAGERIHNSKGELIGLYDTRRELVTTILPKAVSAVVAGAILENEVVSSLPQNTIAQVPVATMSQSSSFGLVATAEAAPSSAEADDLTISPPLSEDKSSPASTNRFMYFVLIGVLTLAAVSLLLPKKTKTDHV